jgi:hypothetical protein
MRSQFIGGLLAMYALSTSAATADRQVALDEVAIADYADFTHAVAFYVDAPINIQKEMAKTVQRTRRENQAECASKKESHWLCISKNFRYFRGITGTGEESKSGYVCVDEWWVTRHKYYPEKMMVSDGCIQIKWDDGKRGYELQWPEP